MQSIQSAKLSVRKLLASFMILATLGLGGATIVAPPEASAHQNFYCGFGRSPDYGWPVKWDNYQSSYYAGGGYYSMTYAEFEYAWWGGNSYKFNHYYTKTCRP